MDQIPLILPSLVVLAVAALEWTRTRAVAAVALVAAFVLLVAAIGHPGFSAEEVLAYGHELLAAPVAAARVVGAGCFLWSVVRVIRTSPIPW